MDDLAERRAKDFRVFVGTALASYGWLSFWAFMYFMTSWGAAAPAAPDPGLGLIYPHNEHGRITYFSAFQATACGLILLTGVPLFFVGAAITPMLRLPGEVRRSSWPDDPRKIWRWGCATGVACLTLMLFVAGPPLVGALNAAGVILSLG